LPDPTPALSVKNISKSFGDKRILKGISLDAHQGDVISILGASGSGKSTFLRCINLLETPDTGEITVGGETVTMRQRNGRAEPSDRKQVDRIRTQLGMVFQSFNLWSHMTILQNLIEGPVHVLKRPRADCVAEAESLLEKVGIADKLHHYPAQLSGGQQQRVSIIQQLLKGSDFLLLDEPFSGLDVCMLDKVVELLLQVSLSDELKTLIIVSHDIVTAVAISDTVFILGRQAGLAGSTIVREIDLMERGLAWQKGVREEKVFAETVREIKKWL